MSTVAGKLKTLADIPQLRFSTTGALTVLGAAQNKGTCTDLYLVLTVNSDGAAAVGGTTNVVVQGSNLTATATSNWTNVVADKGPALAGFTASSSAPIVLHFAQLQSQFYRISVNATTSATAAVGAVWVFHQVEDSTDATTQ